MRVCSIDLETRWTAELRKVGAPAYFEHHETDVYCLAFHVVGSPGCTALWRQGEPPPSVLVDHVAHGGKLCGWNVVGFDRLGWKRRLAPWYGFPEIDDDSWLDSMHLAAHANLPRSLDGCARAVGVPYVGDLKDNARLLRVTNRTRTPVMSEADRLWLEGRCVQDVAMEEATLLRLPPWPGMEPWLSMPAIDRRINDRGVLIDVELVRGLARAAQLETARLDADMADTTRGVVPRTSNVGALKEWLVSRGVKLPPKAAPVEDEEIGLDGEDEEDDKPGSAGSKWRLRKADLADLLARPEVPDDCRDALSFRQEAGKASVAKLRRILSSVDALGRLCNALTLGGAQQTLRWSSTAVQVHNLVRDVFANPDEVAEVNGLDAKKDRDLVERLCGVSLRTAIEVGRTGDPDLIRAMFQRVRRDAQGREYVEGVLAWISRMLRRCLSAPEGMLLLNGDYAQVEARLPMWISGQQDKVEAYVRGEDMYRRQASPIFRVEPESLTKQQRQAGKVTILACGFGGGVDALVAMAMNYGLRLSRDEGSFYVNGFRDDNQFLKAFWYANLECARMAVRQPGREFFVPPLGLMSWRLDGACLLYRLPSGRCLRYWQPELRQGYWPDGTPKQDPDLTVLAVKGRAVFRRTLWHGLATENGIQAMAADLLANALFNMDREGIPVVVHVHDNAAAECAEDRAEAMLPLFRQCMLDAPWWASGLPIAVEAEASARFG